MAGSRIRIERQIRDPEWRSRRDSIELNQERFEGPTHPITITDLDGRWTREAPHTALPFTDSSVERIEITGVVEYVRDDRTLFNELDRITAPAGLLCLRVPNDGALAGCDSLNLYRYASDVTGRGVRIPEVQEVGFRRHYSVLDIADLLGDRFEVRRAWTTGTGLGELVHASGLASLTLPRSSPDPYLGLRSRFLRLIELDRAIPVPGVGFWQWVELRKR